MQDNEAASDADVLIRLGAAAAPGRDADGYHAEGTGWPELTNDPSGAPMLAAGPSATGRPASLDPGYWSLPAFRDLAKPTGDDRWRRLADAVVPLTERFTDAGRLLPPDWVALTADGALRPEPGPGRTQPHTQYGLDAQRLVVWLRASCDQGARSLAAGW